MKQRVTYISRSLVAGCFDCYGNDARWEGKNAQGVAARHHDATGHVTWVDVGMSIRYGQDAEEKKESGGK